MRSFVVSLAATILAFVCGIVTASSWNSNKTEYTKRIIVERCPLTDNSAPAPAATPVPPREVVFGDGLRMVPEEVKLKSEYLRYDIDLHYPQIMGTNDLHLRKLNQQLKQFATEQYEGMLYPSKADLRYYRAQWPGVFNSVNMGYDIRLASDSIVSLYLNSYTYGIGAAHSVHHSYSVNYDLVSGKELKLSDIFKRGSNYLELISSYCKEELSEVHGPTVMSHKGLAPRAENFKNWNLTRTGITLNFDECELFGCASGEQTVEIPFTALAKQLNLNNL